MLFIALTTTACVGAGADEPEAPPPTTAERRDATRSAWKPRIILNVTGHPPRRGQPVDYDAMIRDRLNAHESRVLYEHHFGKFPRVRHGGEVRHGGAACLWTNEQWIEHLGTLRSDLEKAGLAGYSGLIVLDHEGNYPTWDNTNKGLREHVRERLRASEARRGERVDEAELERRAEEMYNGAQRRFLTRTFGVIRDVAPRAELALWSYPRPEYVAEDEEWMLDLVDVLCPAVYFIVDVDDEKSRKELCAAVDRRLSVAAPLAEEHGKRLALYVNTKFNRKVKGRQGDIPSDEDYRAVLWYATYRWGVREFIVWVGAGGDQRSYEHAVRSVEELLAWVERTEWPTPGEGAPDAE